MQKRKALFVISGSAIKNIKTINLFRAVCAFVAVLIVSQNIVIGESKEEAVEIYRQMGYVVVTPEGPEDGGDFGPKLREPKLLEFKRLWIMPNRSIKDHTKTRIFTFLKVITNFLRP